MDKAKHFHGPEQTAISIPVCDKLPLLLSIIPSTEAGPETLKGWSIVSDNSPGGCQSP